MPGTVTVEEYLGRIGPVTDPESVLAWLTEAQEAHLTTVPFENLDIHLDVPIELDDDRLLDKVVRRRRGGFCYELNGTFIWLLRAVGFQADLLEAQVAVDDEHYTDPFDHAVIRGVDRRAALARRRGVRRARPPAVPPGRRRDPCRGRPVVALGRPAPWVPRPRPPERGRRLVA
jgi:hypothetical protein